MKILERKKVELYFSDVEANIKAGLDVTDTYILFASSDDANKVYDVLSNHDAFDGIYNIVDKLSSKIIKLTGEIVVKFLHTNILVVSVYNNWE